MVIRVAALLFACCALVACEGSRARTGGEPRARSDSGSSVTDTGGSDRGDLGDLGEVIDAPDAGSNEDAALVSDATPLADATSFLDATMSGHPDAAGTADASAAYCRGACNTASDCVTSPSTAISDTDNYTCPQGRCEYHGCNTTAECTSTFNSNDYVCVSIPGYAFPTCLKGCTTPNDCVSPGTPLYDAENYSCVNGGCKWLGCLDAQECRDTFQDNSYVCEPIQGGDPGFLTCIKPCSTVNDCGASTSPAYDADNYLCTAQRCEYLGCLSTSECQASFPTGNYVCE